MAFTPKPSTSTGPSMMDLINLGGNSSAGPMGAIMAFMDPNASFYYGGGNGGQGHYGSVADMWRSAHPTPLNVTGATGGNSGSNGTGGTGGTGATGLANDPRVKAGLPAWWVDWLNTSGQYGGIPHQGGLLD